MKTKPYIYYIIFLTLNCLNAQISGIVNTYTKVTAITTPCPVITVSDVSGFAIDDKVLIIQMKGATVSTANNANTFGNITAYNDAGNYEFAEIKDIQGLDIHLKYELIRTYTPADLVQLVRIPQYTDVTVTGTLTAQAWNGNTGGVLVFEASGTLTLNADIDVSGLGFIGGLPNDNNSGNNPCSSNILSTNNTNILAAGKGESISQYIVGSENGYGKQANGGGGGLSNNTGGGGGGNFSVGGKGGNQAVVAATNAGCNPGFVGVGNAGIGGLALTYSNALNKLFMGGGGGSGQQNNLHNGGHSTPGGKGGGIVLIKALSIVGNSFNIKNNGIRSTGIVPAVGDAAGGGGGGGCVAIDCATFTSLNIETRGGNGDNVTDGTGRDIGPGGGGGGGVLWVSTATLSANISFNASGGTAGISSVSNHNHGAVPGSNGGSLTDLQIPESNTPATGCTAPLQLLSFTATLQNNRVLIRWTTAQETDISHYQIQRSVDGTHFEAIANIGSQKGTGIHHYVFSDLNIPDQDLVYYRLVEINPRHTAKQLSTLSVQNNLSNQWMEVTPNPFNNKLTIKPFLSIQQIELIDVNGKVILKLEALQEGNSLELNTDNIHAGFYLLKVVHDGELRYEKLLKRQP